MKHVVVKFHTRFHKQVFSKKELYRFWFKYVPDNDTGYLTIGPVNDENAGMFEHIYRDYIVTVLNTN